MRKKIYEIQPKGQDTQYVRGTARVAQAIVRALHAQGIHASMRTITNAAERRVILAAATV